MCVCVCFVAGGWGCNDLNILHFWEFCPNFRQSEQFVKKLSVLSQNLAKPENSHKLYDANANKIKISLFCTLLAIDKTKKKM